MEPWARAVVGTGVVGAWVENYLGKIYVLIICFQISNDKQNGQVQVFLLLFVEHRIVLQS